MTWEKECLDRRMSHPERSEESKIILSEDADNQKILELFHKKMI